MSRIAPRLHRIIVDLKRRHVFRVGATYIVVAWLLVQVTATTFPLLRLPDWTATLIVVLALLGFPVTVVLAWAFDWTPEGPRRVESGPPLAALEVPASGSTADPTLAPFDLLSGSPAVDDLSIAVLPFVNMSSDPDNEYFSDGITEDVLTNLAKISGLRVISRTSVMPYKGTRKGIREIGRELRVNYVLEGSVRRERLRVRITGQLVRASTDEQLWAEHYDRELTDIFAVQSEIARQIAGTLQARITRVEEHRLENAPAGNMTAYDLFLRGREYARRRRREDYDIAIDFYERAIKADPAYAPAYAALSMVYAVKASNFNEGVECAAEAVAWAERALQIDPELATGHAALGLTHLISGFYSEATAELQRAVGLDASNSQAIMNLGVVHGLSGRPDEALGWFRQAAQVDPLRAFECYSNMAVACMEVGMLDSADILIARSLDLRPDYLVTATAALMLACRRGRFEEASRSAELLCTKYRDSPRALTWAGNLDLLRGNVESARAALERAYQLSPVAMGPSTAASVLLAYTLLQTGEEDRAESLLAEYERFALQEIGRGSRSRDIRYSLAALHAVRAELAEALHWLRESVDAGWIDRWYSGLDPLLRPLRAAPEFEPLLDSMADRASRMRKRIEREAFATPVP